MAGPFTRLPPPPRVQDEKEWGRWYQNIYKILGTVNGGVGWNIINKVGSKLEDIEGSTEAVHDLVALLLQPGNAIILTYNDVGNSLTIALNNEVVQDMLSTFIINGNAITWTYDDTANTLKADIVKAVALTNASASSVSVTTADADVTYDSAERDLINELKADVNQLTTDLNAVTGKLNTLLANLRTAGFMVT